MQFTIKSKAYGQQVILEDTSIIINKGLSIIIGPSGVGKTTLVNMLIGRDIKWDGNINWNGQIDKQKYVEEMKGNCFFVEQQNHFLESETALSNIAIWCKIFNIKFDQQLLVHLAATLKIAHLLGKNITQLSGGEKQRMAILRALMCKPSFLVCDEPTSSLDRRNKTVVYEMLKSLSEELPIIMISHDKDSVKYADTLYEIKDKKIITNNKPTPVALSMKPTKINFATINKLVFKENKKFLWMTTFLFAISFGCLQVNQAFKTEIDLATQKFNDTYQAVYEIELEKYSDAENAQSFETFATNYSVEYEVTVENQVATFEVPIEQVESFCSEAKASYSCFANEYWAHKQAQKELKYDKTISGVVLLIETIIFLSIMYMVNLWFKRHNFATKTIRQCNLNFQQVTKVFAIKTLWSYAPLFIFFLTGAMYITAMLILLLIYTLLVNYKIYYKGK